MSFDNFVILAALNIQQDFFYCCCFFVSGSVLFVVMLISSNKTKQNISNTSIKKPQKLLISMNKKKSISLDG